MDRMSERVMPLWPECVAQGSANTVSYRVLGRSAVFGRRRRGSPEKAVRPVALTRKAGDGDFRLPRSAGSVQSPRGSSARRVAEYPKRSSEAGRFASSDGA